MTTPNSKKRAIFVNYRIEEYKSLREEILTILKRGYQIYFSAIALSVALLGYGAKLDNPTPATPIYSVKSDSLTPIPAESHNLIIDIIVIMSPVLVLHLGFGLIREQVKTLRRNAAYIRIFHEDKNRGAFWETRLNELRKIRKNKPTTINDITVVDMLKGFPTIIDIFSIFICFPMACVKLFNNTSQNNAYSIATIILIVCVALAIQRHRQCKDLQGGGKIEEEYAQEWEEIKNDKIAIDQADEPIWKKLLKVLIRLFLWLPKWLWGRWRRLRRGI